MVNFDNSRPTPFVPTLDVEHRGKAAASAARGFLRFSNYQLQYRAEHIRGVYGAALCPYLSDRPLGCPKA
jgi:hypothetical protein